MQRRSQASKNVGKRMWTPPVNSKASGKVESVLPCEPTWSHSQMIQVSFSLSLSLSPSILSLSSLKKEAEAGRRFTYCICLVRDTTLSPHLQTSSPLLYILLTPTDVSHIYLKKMHFANECFYAYFCPLGAILTQILSLHHSNYSDRYYSYMQNPTTSHSLHSYYLSSSTLFKYHCLTT